MKNRTAPTTTERKSKSRTDQQKRARQLKTIQSKQRARDWAEKRKAQINPVTTAKEVSTGKLASRTAKDVLKR